MEYVSTIVVSCILIGIVGCIVRSMIKEKRSGKCSGGCASCGSTSTCHSNKTSLVNEYHKDHCCGS